MNVLRPRGRRGSRRIAMALVALAAMLGIGCGSTNVTKPDKLDTATLAELAKPATVLIMTRYDGVATVPDVYIPPDRLQTLEATLIQKVQSGQVAADERAIIEAAVVEIAQNWRQYFAATGGSRDLNISITGVGSGFFVTPDGYIVTNAHVVSEEERVLKSQIAQQALGQLLQQDMKDLQQEIGAVSEETAKQLQAAIIDFYANNMAISDVKRTVSMLYGVGVPGVTIEPKPSPAEVIENGLGTPIPGKDVAILKVQGENFPTLPLGDDKALRTGNQVFPLGYPADATFFEAFDPSAVTESSLTSGLVSAKKPMEGGWSAIQTDAAIRGGNSGGPALNERGEVIGLSTFGLRDQETGADAQGANFLVPASIVKEFLDRTNVTPKAGPVTEKWTEAVLLMEKGYYKAAQERLTEVDSLRPGMPWVQAARQTAQQEILAGRDKTPSPLVPFIIGGGVALVGVILVVVLAMAMRKKPQGAMVASAPQAQSWAQPQAQPQMPPQNPSPAMPQTPPPGYQAPPAQPMPPTESAPPAAPPAQLPPQSPPPQAPPGPPPGPPPGNA